MANETYEVSYLVEQLPHCDLLRLSLLTGWFVVSARQVICGRFGFSVFPFTHSSLSRVKSKLFLVLFGIWEIHPSPLLPHPLWSLRSGHFPESRTFSFGTWEVPERLAMFPVQLLNCFHSLAFKSPYIHTYIWDPDIFLWLLGPFALSSLVFEIRTFAWDPRTFSWDPPRPKSRTMCLSPFASPSLVFEIRTFSFGTWECFLTNIVWVKFELFSFIGRRCLLFRGITTWFQI